MFQWIDNMQNMYVDLKFDKIHYCCTRGLLISSLDITSCIQHILLQVFILNTRINFYSILLEMKFSRYSNTRVDNSGIIFCKSWLESDSNKIDPHGLERRKEEYTLAIRSRNEPPGPSYIRLFCLKFFTFRKKEKKSDFI